MDEIDGFKAVNSRSKGGLQAGGELSTQSGFEPETQRCPSASKSTGCESHIPENNIRASHWTEGVILHTGRRGETFTWDIAFES